MKITGEWTQYPAIEVFRLLAECGCKPSKVDEGIRHSIIQFDNGIELHVASHEYFPPEFRVRQV